VIDAGPGVLDRKAMDESHENSQWRSNYALTPGVYDEMYSAPGVLRPAWKPFISQLDTLGPVELSRRWEQARHLIHENGVTYNVYGDPKGLNRPWELDALPLLISTEDWAKLQRGLIQRATLINHILVDLYGEQKLLHAGLLPPEMITAHSGFLRACHGLPVPHRQYLNLYAVDIGRASDGQFLALADRTQSPAGAGYVLENRIVLSRILTEVFQDCQIERLALFFRRMRQTLSNLAPHNRDNPRVVLLTPGPYNETYFEHAYLARYLNYTLVEGGDLTVRDACLYLKTLGGLHRVDVVLRRMDDSFCDPLELRGDSTLGVPGLVQAIRAGNVALANPLGTGLAEMPAINAFLPELCRHFLNEDLLLPTVKTYWCGRKKWLEHVVANISRMVIKDTYPSRNDSVFGGNMSDDERSELIAHLRARPHLYVAQEQFSISTVPVWQDGKLESQHAALRTYLVSTDDSYELMPGGLTQILHETDTLTFSMQHGGGSKDTWVQASGPVSNFSLLRQAGQSIVISRGGSDLPSRVADNLFWLGRYVERAESMVRLIRTIMIRLSDKSVSLEARELPNLIVGLQQQRLRTEHLQPEIAGVTPSEELTVVMNETFAPGGLYDTLGLLQTVARAVRDRLSNDTWRVILGLDANVWPKGRHERINELLARLNFMLTTLASFGGLASESMTRGQVWRFLDMGRRLERAVNLASLARSLLVKFDVEEAPLLESVLEIADSSMTYRRRYLASLQFAPVLDLILLDESNPRSISFQLAALNDHTQSLPSDPHPLQFSQQQRVVFGCIASLRLLELDAICKPDESGARVELESVLLRLEKDMLKLSDLITRDYLSHAQSSQQLASYSGGDAE
jgi:uncharacterized circularly permuted ATP-grasp superfamily protein/uncharacterized alpha-E superfamily protein